MLDKQDTGVTVLQQFDRELEVELTNFGNHYQYNLSCIAQQFLKYSVNKLIYRF